MIPEGDIDEPLVDEPPASPNADLTAEPNADVVAEPSTAPQALPLAQSDAAASAVRVAKEDSVPDQAIDAAPSVNTLDNAAAPSPESVSSPHTSESAAEGDEVEADEEVEVDAVHLNTTRVFLRNPEKNLFYYADRAQGQIFCWNRTTGALKPVQ